MDSNLLDILWIIVASCLVFIMQAGFAMVETGLTRSKNSINVAIKNLTDLGVSTLIFWLVGFGFMFGKSYLGYIGTNNFIFSSDTTWKAAFFLFQAMFCSTSATIVSGAIAERVKYGAYIIGTIFLSGIIYPIFGHWVWGGIVPNTGAGWLGALGFIDFAGSTVVHSLGGWVALAFLFVIGPRTGRYKKDGSPVSISGSNIPMVVLGVLILWFGWFGFNGGSTLAMDNTVPGIILKTTLSAAAGMVFTLAAGWSILKKPDVGLVMNGALAGLVAITAPVHAVSEAQAILIGGIGGLVMLFSTFALDKLKIDDAVGAIPVHLVAGIWGTLAVGIFGDLNILGTGLSRESQIISQLIGILTCGGWAFISAFIFLKVLNRFYPLRISITDELDGLNKCEHGASTEIFDLYTVLHEQASTGDITLRAPVEPFTEVGQIASIYNEVMDKLEDNTVEKSDYLNILANVSDGMFLLTRDGRITKYYSHSSDQILESKSLSGKILVEIIEPIFMESERDQIQDFIDLSFDPEIAWRHIERLNPIAEVDAFFDNAEGGFRIKHLEFNFKRVEKDGIINNLLVLLKDVTEEYDLNLEIEKTKEKGNLDMELLYRILHVEPNILKEFFNNASKDLSGINSIFKDHRYTPKNRLQRAFRLSHGLKGDAELLDLSFISEKAEELEFSMQKMLKDDVIDTNKFIPLTIKFSELQKVFSKIEGLLDKWTVFSGNIGSDVSSPSEYFESYLLKMTQRISNKQNKNVQLNLHNFSLNLFPESNHKSIRDILVQLIRNTISHGLELTEERISNNKLDIGRIQIKTESKNDFITLTYSDDGRGLDIERIRLQALENGHITDNQYKLLPDSSIPKLIFQDGLSTADSSDIMAGKGVGMPLISNIINKLDGSIGIKTKQNIGCQFIINIPKAKTIEKVTN
ncbi:MAG: ammonium transporter [Spirochaetaceae bacterium]